MQDASQNTQFFEDTWFAYQLRLGIVHNGTKVGYDDS